MGFMTIDGQRVEFTNEPNVLTVIRNAEIDIPTLCYHSELSIYGACRLCTVENDRGKTFASCAEPPRDGMVIYTNTPRLMRYRRTILELLLAAHDRDCTTCVKSGECHLLATTFEWADAIDAERAARSKARAEALLAQKNLDKRDMELAEARLRRALVRSSVAARKNI